MFTLILADGRELTGFRRNGTNYVSPERVDESVFRDNLGTLIITDGTEDTVVLRNAELIQQVQYKDGWYLCFREKTPQDLALAAMQQWQQERQAPSIPLPLRPGIVPTDGTINSYRRGADGLVVVSVAATPTGEASAHVADLPEGCRPSATVQAGDISIRSDGSVWASGSMAGTVCYYV